MDYFFENTRKRYFEWLLTEVARFNPVMAKDRNLFQEVRRPEGIEIKIKGEVFYVPNLSLCSFEQLRVVHETIETKYQELVEYLPDNHLCKCNPVFQEMFLCHLNRNIFGSLEAVMTEEEYHLLLLAAGACKIGKVMQMEPTICDSIGLTIGNIKSRGVLSLEVLRRWGVIDIFLPDAREVLTTAISQNDGEDSSVLAIDPTDSQKMMGYLFAALLRDIRKMRMLAYGLTCFFCKEDTKGKHSSRNNIQGEQGTINPLELIDEFMLRRRFDKSRCCSYESWALWHLSQIFDIDLGLVFKETCQTGMISQFLGYLRNQLPENQHSIIENATEEYIRDYML